MSLPEDIPEDREQDPETQREEYSEYQFKEMLALIHSEVSEALRQGNPPDDKIPQFSGAEAELADVIIRIMDLSCARNWDVAGAVTAKIEMNKSREKMHGGKKF